MKIPGFTLRGFKRPREAICRTLNKLELSCIVDAVSERDRERLDELDRLVKEKRGELRRQG